MCIRDSPMGGPWWPCVYLARLWRYGASSVGRTNVDAQKKKKKVEEEKGRKRRRERGKREKWEVKGEGKKKEKGKGKWKGKWKGKEMENGKGKGKGEGEMKGKGEGKGKGKEESLSKVGRTDARTLRWFYTLSNATLSIGQTIINVVSHVTIWFVTCTLL